MLLDLYLHAWAQLRFLFSTCLPFFSSSKLNHMLRSCPGKCRNLRVMAFLERLHHQFDCIIEHGPTSFNLAQS